MDRSRQILSAIDELKQIRSDIRSNSSLDMVRRSFERVQEIRRQHQDDFDLQIIIADAQQEIIERARALRGDVGSVAPAALTRPVKASRFAEPTPEIEPEAAEIPADVPKLDRKSWQLAVGLAVLFTVGICTAFFYAIQAARRVNFPPEPAATATAPKAVDKTSTAAVPAPVAAVQSAPSLRLYTDLTAGTATIDDQPAKDLVDGELNIDSLTPGQHTVKVESHGGSATFNFSLDNDQDVPRVTEIPKSTNAMVVLVSVQDGTGRLTTDTNGASVTLDQKPAGTVGSDGLLLSDLGKQDHELEVTQARDHQKFELTYTPAPTLTVFVKSDPSTGVLTVSTGQDGVSVFINDYPYKRVTEHGEIRIPLKVGSYRIRVHKTGFTDPAVSTVDVQKSAEASVQFRLEAAAPQFAILQIKGATPATAVFVDRLMAATVGADGTAKVINVQPGEHVIELHHDQAVTKQITRTFELGQTVTLAGTDVALDRLAADNKSVIPANPGPALIPPPEVPQLSPAAQAAAAGEQVHKGGGFVPYHTPKSAGNYYFQAHAKLGGVLKHGKLQWYAGYQDAENYVLFSIDGKHAEVREFKDGKAVDLGRISFPAVSDEWVQVEMAVKADTLQARVKTGEGGWTDLSPVTTSGRDFTKDSVGLYIPSNEEVAVANFRFSGR